MSEPILGDVMKGQVLSVPAGEYAKAAVTADWTLLTLYIAILAIAVITYRSRRSPTRTSNVALVIPSVANEDVRDSLYDTLTHNRFLGIPMYVVVDEGAPLKDELEKIRWINLVVVPKSFRPDLVGKGRALRYFVENYVIKRPDMWYVFIDDDNLVLDDRFLYEIPYYERRGYVAFNPVLAPRKGRSYIAYILDHARVLDDISFFRLFTGVVGRPLVGLHGELLGVKGDFLVKVDAFNEASKVEDYVLASKIIRLGGMTWQSRTRVSILSPNSIRDLVKQRSRWHSGILESLPKVPFSMRAATLFKSFARTIGLIALWALFPFMNSVLFLIVGLMTGLVYWGVYAYGASRSGKLIYIFTIPAFWLIEAAGFLYGLFKVRNRDFIVIDKRI
ncbi:MAG: glycosyltransferase [Acidilobus sp.]